jgi:hypothetical protein
MTDKCVADKTGTVSDTELMAARSFRERKRRRLERPLRDWEVFTNPL